ncbi:MAG TPA: hypothetical protein PKY59_20315 [Pyrinomonadaceae bacterium]|nr:hypothetical protein [Pyrinomonadaceae bacterium]
MKSISLILGIISIAVMAVSAAILFVGFYAMLASKGANADELSMPIIFAVILLLISALCAVCGMIFGIVSFFKNADNRTLAIIGLILNSIPLISLFGSIIYGVFWLTENVKGRPFG